MAPTTIPGKTASPMENSRVGKTIVNQHSSQPRMVRLFGALGQLVGKNALEDLIREGQLLLVSAGHQRLEGGVVSCVVGAMKRKFLDHDGMWLLV